MVADHLSGLAIALCHGSYHSPDPNEPLIHAFTVQGIDAYCLQLPTSAPEIPNIGDLEDTDYDREAPEGG